MREKHGIAAIGIRQTPPCFKPQAAGGLLHAFATKTVRRYGEIFADETDFPSRAKLLTPRSVRLGGSAADAVLEMNGRHVQTRLRQQQKKRRAIRSAAEADEYAAMHRLPLQEVMHKMKQAVFKGHKRQKQLKGQSGH